MQGAHKDKTEPTGAEADMAREYKDVIVGLDIGTAKVMAVVAEVMSNGELKLAGWAWPPATA
jgi:cell division protein FtsA